MKPGPKIKPKDCGNPDCGKQFMPWRSTQTACSVPCAGVVAAAGLAKREQRKRNAQLRDARKAKREYRVRTLSIGKLGQLAQHEFNHYIRERDFGQPCISCGRNTGSKMNAGHYRTTKAAPHLRYDERACFLQCEHCNTYLSGNQVEYRKALVARFGVAYVEALEDDSFAEPWNRDELIAIRRTYLSKWKELRAVREGKAA